MKQNELLGFMFAQETEQMVKNAVFHLQKSELELKVVVEEYDSLYFFLNEEMIGLADYGELRADFLEIRKFIIFAGQFEKYCDDVISRDLLVNLFKGICIRYIENIAQRKGMIFYKTSEMFSFLKEAKAMGKYIDNELSDVACKISVDVKSQQEYFAQA